MASANYKASPPFLRFPSTQQQVSILLSLLLLCLALMMPFITSTSTSTTSTSDSTAKGCIKAERDALLAFKAQIIHHKAHPISSWGDQNDDDCCHWVGVRCDNNTGHVFRLELQRRRPRQLYDWNPYKCDEWDLSGNISESLIGLQHLTYLDLSNNCFLNISIPKFLGSLENLVHLDLSYSGFTGIIPHELGNLTRLRYLNLATYYYYERLALKVDDAEWLSGLSSLRYLSMNYVNFYGVDNVMQSLNKLHHLKHVSLSDCSMNSIPESLPHLNFTSLTFMDIGWNMFYNTSIPEWLFRIPNLRELYMYNTGFTGAIPSSVGNATSLQLLGLSYNRGISGDMPRGFGNLCNLQSLYLDGTFVGKSLEEDFRDAFSRCIRRNLNVLSFTGSSLQGPLPDWLGEFTNLTSLYLSYNSFNSSIPASIGRLSKLQTLQIHRSALNGSIPESLGRLSGLRYLDLGYNDLNGPIPESLGRLSGLQYLDLGYNDLNGPIPDLFWNITYSISDLDLSNNEINGRLPHRFKFQAKDGVRIFLGSNHFEGSIPYFPPNVYALDLSNNSFSGIIPSDLGNFEGIRPRLSFLSLSSNNLNGSIPSSLCNLVDLVLLKLSNNHLEGTIPNCWNNLIGLQYFILENNSLAGEVPNSLISSSQSLQVLHLSNNQLHGEFPSFLKKCTSMTTLALDHNNFSGEIPSWVGEIMTSLMIMTLKENNFSGNLPLLSNLASLHFLDLSHNSFVGNIPQSYGNLMGMINVSMNGGASFSSYEVLVITITVSTKGLDLEYGVILSSFKFIDLSANNLSGQIPKEIVNLAGLQNLDLSCNNLSGEIPIDIGRMQSLESLDLSRNELIGPIPPSLSTLHFLESLNLSYNNLSGKIPYASQLSTFNDPSIYANNLNLCGAPLDKNCASDEPPSTSHDQENDDDDDDEDGPPIWFYIGLMLGFVFGFWIVWGILLFKKTWRHIYFIFLDQTYDMMYVKIVVTIHRIKRALVVMKSM